MLAMTIPTIILSPLTGRIVAARGARTSDAHRARLRGDRYRAPRGGQREHAVAHADGAHVRRRRRGLSVAAATSEAMGAIPPERSGMASGHPELATRARLDRGLRDHGQRPRGHHLARAAARSRRRSSPTPAQRDAVVERVVDDANPQAVAGLIGPGKPLPDNVTEDDAVAARGRRRVRHRHPRRHARRLRRRAQRSASSAGGCFRASATHRSRRSCSSPADEPVEGTSVGWPGDRWSRFAVGSSGDGGRRRGRARTAPPFARLDTERTRRRLLLVEAPPESLRRISGMARMCRR